MTAADLHAAVLADPYDDGVRLVYADWLQENEEPERAEFIRLQIELLNYQGEREWLESKVKRHTELCEAYVLNCAKWSKEFAISVFGKNWLQLSAGVQWGWSRGFPDEIRCTMREWCGGRCSRCDGSGVYEPHEDSGGPMQCRPCKGKGRTPGIAKAVCEAWPVTKVVMTDRKPLATSKRFNWYRHAGNCPAPDDLPNDLFGQIDLIGDGQYFATYITEDRAYAALSHAALNYGRRLSGMPELKQG